MQSLQLTIKELTAPEPIYNVTPMELFAAIRPLDQQELRTAIRLLGYSQFLQTPYWWAVSQRVKELAGNRCQICNSGVDLHAHHRSYECHGTEHLHLGELTCLCDKCHGKAHNAGIATTPPPKTQGQPHRSKPSKFLRKAAIKLSISARHLETLPIERVNQMLANHANHRYEKRKARHERRLAKWKAQTVAIALQKPSDPF